MRNDSDGKLETKAFKKSKSFVFRCLCFQFSSEISFDEGQEVKFL